MIDKITKKAHNFFLRLSKRMHHEVITRMNFIRVMLRKKWNKKWRERTKKFQYRELISKVNHRYLKIHAEQFKAHNAFMIQLKMNKIRFNQFLHERRILNILTAHCSCDDDIITIKHVLFSCSNWRKEKRKMLNRVKITNVKRIFSESKTITIVMCIILTTDLLNQFQTTKSSKEKNVSRL